MLLQNLDAYIWRQLIFLKQTEGVFASFMVLYKRMSGGG